MDILTINGSPVFVNGKIVQIETSPTPTLGPLCFTNNTTSGEDAGIALTLVGDASVKYSTDGTTWNDYVSETPIMFSNIGDKLYFKGTNTGRIGQFEMAGSISASGNVMSLIDETCQSTTIPENAFNNLFYNCESLTSAPAIPATTVGQTGCYQMFAGCTALTTPPTLPATTLAYGSYYSMFSECTALTTAPSLPATDLSMYSYATMFMGCTSLTTVPALPATTLGEECYYGMFANCDSLKVYATSGEGHDKAWTIPTSGTITDYPTQSEMFAETPGDYEEAETVTLNATFYTQNTPV